MRPVTTTVRRVLLTGLTAAGLLASISLPATGRAEPPVAAAAGAPLTTAGEQDVPHGHIVSLIKRMTLEEKIGQLFITYAYGDSADTTDPADVAANQAVHGVDNAAQLVEHYKIGGVVYFGWSGNVDAPEQIAALSDGIQEAALAQRLAIPALIGVDQETGIVARIGPPATQLPGAMAVGAGRRPEDAWLAARITGEELRALGITQDFAPVADVNVNALNPVIGVRSFGSDPALVSAMVAQQIIGLEEVGVAATVKHFPGHGDTAVDSHYGLPLIEHTLAEIEQIDLPPFQAAIAAGADSIMTAHILVPALDPSGDPATLSHPILTGLLRQQLGYQGVIVTDSLEMAGVRQKYGDDRVPVLAIKAGADMLLMPPDTALAYNAVLEAVHSKEIDEQRIDESVYRILRLKFQRGLFDDPFSYADELDQIVGTPEHLAAAQEITDHTVTLLKDEADVLPLSEDEALDVLVTGWGVSTVSALGEAIGARGQNVVTLQTGQEPTQAMIDAAVMAAQDSDLVVVSSMRAGQRPTQVQLVEALRATGKPVIVTAVRDPYDIAYMTEVETYFATYSSLPVAMESLTRVLFGEIEPQGRLPVMIPTAMDPAAELYPFGHGLGTAN